ncbi:MAG TPA: polysaccharide biosynthesis tyrosine autokinase [Verrucomicrobiae bacterium]|nr:polysaccharide biosynthesis tyrosine autokinase [Verrucomicrobiae bacterium]
MDSFKTSPPQETKLHFLDYWRIIRIRKAIIITVFLITAIIATAVTFILPESYASTARIIVESDISNISMGEERSPSQTVYDPYFLQTTYELIQSQAVLSNVVSALNLNVEWGKKYYNGETLKTSEAVEFLKRRMHLDTIRNTKYITITVYNENKDDAAKLANAVADAYQNYRLEQRQELTSKGIDKLEAQFEDDEMRIQVLSTNVEHLRRTLNIMDFDPNSISPTPTLTQADLQRLNEQKIEGETSYKMLQTRLTELQTYPTDKLREVLPTVANDSSLSGLLDKLNTAKQEYVVLTNDYNPTNNMNPVRVRSEIDELNHQVDDRVAGIMAALDSQVKSQKAALDAITNAVEDAKANDQAEALRGLPYWEKKRELENRRQFHSLLADKILSEKTLLEIPKTAMVTITDPATPGDAPVKPNKPVNIVLGLVFGLVMGIGLAFFIEYLDTSVKTIDDVERAFQAPVLGVIPQNVGFLGEEGTESTHAEAYRVLRTNLLFSRKDDKLNSLVVVSAGAGEGKSTTALNLATVFAHTGQRVLLVDSDLRRPTLHKMLRVSNNIGLTNYLLKQNALAEVIQTTSVPLLDFMASGKLPNSSMGVLGSLPMKDMIGELKQRYDFIFFDSPPILGVSDASILASEVDMVLQVIQYRRYPQPMNIRAKQMIEKVGGNFIGIVLNNINVSQDESYYYYTGYYHDYSSRVEEEQPAPARRETPPDDAGEGGIKQKY